MNGEAAMNRTLPTRNTRQTPRKKRWWLRGMLIVLACLIAYGAYNVYGIYKTAKTSYEPLPNRPKSDLRTEEVSIKDRDPVSFLLLGVDSRPGDRGRSDTIMVVTLNPKKESMILFNIPRDTYVDIVGRGTKDKINHAYAFGGVPMAIDTVENFLDIPIDYYAEINMEGFKEAIGVLGGVEVDVPFAFDHGGISFREGPMFMDADTALKYVQMRKKDPRGDFGRNERQQQIVKAILRQSLTVKNFNKVDDVIKSVGSNMKTSVAPADYLTLQDIYRKIDNDHIESFQIEGEGKRMDGIYYYVVSDAERERISQKLKDHLELAER